MLFQKLKYKTNKLLLRGLLFFCATITFVYSNANEQLKNDRIKQEVDSLIKMSISYFQISADSGMLLSQKALRISELNNYEKGRIAALRGIAVFYNQLNKYDYARDYIKSALNFAQKLGDERVLAGVYFSYGFIEAENTHFDKAYEAYYQASNIYLQLGDSSRYAYVLNNIANVYNYNGEEEKALEILKKALDISSKFVAYDQTVLILSNIGGIFSQLNQIDSALKYYGISLGVLEDDDLRNKALIVSGLGTVYFKTDSLKLAKKYFQETLSVAEKMADVKIVGYAYCKLGEVYLKNKVYDSAIICLNIAHDTLLLTSDYLRLQEVALIKANYYKTINDFEKALEFTNLESRYTDSIRSKENTERLAKLKATQEYESKIAEDELRYTRKLMMFAALSVLLILTILLIIRGYIKERKKAVLSELGKNELEKNLKQKDVDLLTKTMHLNEKEELIKSLEEKLKQLGRDLKPSKSRGIQELISEIRVSKSDNIWEEFESRFSSVNDDFIERLKKKYSDLTPKELRLCSLLRLNLSTKEVSVLTHQNPLSINKARFRLRKKLGLNNKEENLTSFLMDF